MEHETNHTTQNEQQFGLLLSYQTAARALGLTKRDVADMVGDGLLKEVKAGGKRRITARSIVHTLGYDPFGCTAFALTDTRCTRLTFEQYAVALLNRGVRKARSRSIENYRCGLGMVGRELGGLPLAEIGEEDLRRAFRKLAARYSKSTLKLCYQTTRVLFRTACEKGDIPRDPACRLELPKSTKPVRRTRERVYTDAQIDRLLRTSKAFDRELYTMFAVLECTGMRPGELLALEWESFDPGAKTIHVYQTVTFEFGAIETLGKAPRRKSVLSVPKSEYSVRTLCLSETAAEALVKWRAALRAEGSRSPFIFPGRNGGFRSLSGAEKKLQAYRAAFGLQDVTFYKFRHTVCTRLVLAGQPISVIQRIMGDNSPDVVTRVYTHVDEDNALRAMQSYLRER